VHPAHPYTSGLIRSIPRSEQRKSTLYTIPGRVPPLSDMPIGCRFRPRCEYAEGACLAPQPIVAVGVDRHARCCRADELRLPGAMAEGVR
jgi:peptide/nickel transport system ATP-binding protein